MIIIINSIICVTIIMQLTLSDLWAVDPELASGLQHVLQFEDGAGPIEDVFGVTFTASTNPLISPAEEEVQYLTHCRLTALYGSAAAA